MDRKILFDFDDILIQPAIVSEIRSRKTIDPWDDLGMLPIITAPMDTVIGAENEQVFLDNKINVCQPRGVETSSGNFKSYSLSDFQKEFIDKDYAPISSAVHHILIDIANGHMRELEITVRDAKEKYGDKLMLMVGNVAHPETYRSLSEAGADYIRVGIGNGGGCLTTQQLGIGYPMGSLVRNCYLVSCELNNPAKIVADGGMKKYSDIIKGLALGADYVMVGSIFNKALESASPCLEPNRKLAGGDWSKISIEDAKKRLDFGNKVHKMFRGMSTKEVQKDWGVENPKTSEGVVRHYEVEYTLSGWVENFEHYLRSAMSYTNSPNLESFIGQVEYNHITENAFNRFNK